MKRAKQLQKRLKPRNPLALAPLLKKGGVHRRSDKHASRARQKARTRGEGEEL